MVQTDYQSEGFPDSVKAKRYDDNTIRGPKYNDGKPPVKYKTFLACVVEHSKCNGQIITNNFVHHCFCPCHRFLVREEEFF